MTELYAIPYETPSERHESFSSRQHCLVLPGNPHSLSRSVTCWTCTIMHTIYRRILHDNHIDYSTESNQIPNSDWDLLHSCPCSRRVRVDSRQISQDMSLYTAGIKYHLSQGKAYTAPWDQASAGAWKFSEHKQLRDRSWTLSGIWASFRHICRVNFSKQSTRKRTLDTFYQNVHQKWPSKVDAVYGTVAVKIRCIPTFQRRLLLHCKWGFRPHSGSLLRSLPCIRSLCFVTVVIFNNHCSPPW